MLVQAKHTRNLRFGFGASILLLIICSAASLISLQSLLTSSRWVDHTNIVSRELAGINALIKDAEADQRYYLITGNERYLENIDTIHVSAEKLMDHIGELTKDNPEQQVSLIRLRENIAARMKILMETADLKKAGQPITIRVMERGRQATVRINTLIGNMANRENALLEQRTARMDSFSGLTPAIVIVATLLAILVTFHYYRRVQTDFKEKMDQQQQLEATTVKTTHRINKIENLANQLSEGDYGIRINDPLTDGLGNLSSSLDKMAESLQDSFNQLSDKQWLQTVLVELNQTMVGEKDLGSLTSDILKCFIKYTRSHAGVFYVAGNNDQLNVNSSFAIEKKALHPIISFGEGIAGQVAANKEILVLTDLKPENITISFATGGIKPGSIAAFPLCHENKVKGVIELASVTGFTPNELEFINRGADSVGIVIEAAQNRKKLQELLEETQSQTEELQAQHRELESLNTELETKTEKIQASEEELRVQQEELIQTNRELAGKGKMLEEKNQQILDRNIEIQQKANELEQSTRYKSEFLANMSHELRTPLNSILLLSRFMAETENLDKEIIEYARVIRSSGEGLLNLIDEILDLSRIEAGKMSIEYADVSLSEIASDLNSLFNPVAKDKNIKFEINLDNRLPRIIHTDRMRLDQILKNLISNSLKFTSKGSISLTVFPAPENPQLVSFTVKDTGIGIPDEKKQLIFEAFQQADGSTRRKFGGTGLGLSISRELAKLLGGSIYLESTPGAGSEFTLSIPVTRFKFASSKNTLNDGLTNGIQPAPSAENPHTASNTGRQRYLSGILPDEVEDDRETIGDGEKTILIVEDDTLFAKALLDLAHKKGFKAITTTRGDQALELARRYQPAAILLDIQLPIKDGWEVMAELKADDKTGKIPVHIMSAIKFEEEVISHSAAEDFIEKSAAADTMHKLFEKLEKRLAQHPKKVLIVEEDIRHAKALSYFLAESNIRSGITAHTEKAISMLQEDNADCVLLEVDILNKDAYAALETIKTTPGLENLPIIVFTGKALSTTEEGRIKKYADSIVVKSAHSYQRILDEVGLFLHLVEETNGIKKSKPKTGTIGEVLAGKTVLIADDDVRNIFSLSKALEKYQMKIISATDGKEVLKQLEENPGVDIVLMDMMMPEMDGYESTGMIRRNQKYKNMPVLAVTAKAMMGDREKCIEAGCSDYISKPIDIDQLISLLRVWLYDKSMNNGNTHPGLN